MNDFQFMCVICVLNSYHCNYLFQLKWSNMSSTSWTAPPNLVNVTIATNHTTTMPNTSITSTTRENHTEITTQTVSSTTEHLHGSHTHEELMSFGWAMLVLILALVMITVLVGLSVNKYRRWSLKKKAKKQQIDNPLYNNHNLGYTVDDFWQSSSDEMYPLCFIEEQNDPLNVLDYSWLYICNWFITPANNTSFA